MIMKGVGFRLVGFTVLNYLGREESQWPLSRLGRPHGKCVGNYLDECEDTVGGTITQVGHPL